MGGGERECTVGPSGSLTTNVAVHFADLFLADGAIDEKSACGSRCTENANY